MASVEWLPIADYSNKYQVSVSTLRRRIKNGKAEVQFNEGKYFLKDLPLSNHSYTPLYEMNNQDTLVPPHKSNINTPHASQGSNGLSVSVSGSERMDLGDAPFISTANNLLNEIKKAYMLVLQEKEEQILILKEEVSNLNMLVNVLEDENNRLKSKPQPSWDV